MASVTAVEVELALRSCWNVSSTIELVGGVSVLGPTARRPSTTKGDVMFRARVIAAVTAVAITAAIGVPVASGLSAGRSPTVAEPAVGVPSVFVPIDAFRTMDTRIEELSGKIGVTIQPVSRAVSYDVVKGFSVVPNDATAVTFNITVTGTEGAGFVQVSRWDAVSGATSTVNWSGDGQTVAGSGVVQVKPIDGPGPYFGVSVGGTPHARTHIIIDITGYYVPAGTG